VHLFLRLGLECSDRSKHFASKPNPALNLIEELHGENLVFRYTPNTGGVVSLTLSQAAMRTMIGV
jgi:hypothetical protein